MMMKSVIGCSAVFTLLASSVYAILPEHVGHYAGTYKENRIDLDTGKTLDRFTGNLNIELKEDESIVLTYASGNNYLFNDTSIGKKYFITRGVFFGSAYYLIKGKIVGKGKKIKTTFTFTHDGTYNEGKMSFKRVIL